MSTQNEMTDLDKTLTRIGEWSARYGRALARNPEAQSLKPMRDVIGNLAASAFVQGASLDEVAEAVGLR